MGEVDRRLVEDINVAHKRCEEAAGAAVGHALDAGRLLTQAKAGVPHGGWLPWLEENFAGSKRTAQVYMRLHEHRDELNAQRVAHLGLREAVKSITAPKDPPPGEDTSNSPSTDTLADAEDHLETALTSARVASLGIAEKLTEVNRGRGWSALGYASFREYVEGEFDFPAALVAGEDGAALGVFVMAENLYGWGHHRAFAEAVDSDPWRHQ